MTRRFVHVGKDAKGAAGFLLASLPALGAVFTGLASLSHTWWQLGLYRFVTALGIGGEWAAGAAMVAEVWPESRRARAANSVDTPYPGSRAAASACSRVRTASASLMVFAVLNARLSAGVTQQALMT